MNKAYRLVWSGRHGGFVAVPEIACARGKGPVRVCVAALAAASLFMTPACAQVDPATGRTTVTTTAGGVPVVGICETPFTGANELVKRVSDVVLASIILVLISPLMLAIAIGVKLSSPGPVVFR